VDTGVGVRRHPLFFLGRFRKDKPVKQHAKVVDGGGGADEAVTVRLSLPAGLVSNHRCCCNLLQLASYASNATSWKGSASVASPGCVLLPGCAFAAPSTPPPQNSSHPKTRLPCRLALKLRTCVPSVSEWRG
jgi:hypothetical protein